MTQHDDKTCPSADVQPTPVPATDETNQYAALWSQLGDADAPAPAVSFHGPRHALPSLYDVSGFASTSVAVANAAVAAWLSEREGRSPRAVTVDRVHASLAFQCERHLRDLDQPLPATWDPIAGDYAAADGFIRLHTNYAHHRQAALSVLQVAADRAAVAEAVRDLPASALEQAIVEAGGCAAAMHTAEAWRQHPHGQHVRAQPLCARTVVAPSGRPRPLPDLGPGDKPLLGLRVLDLTRVIAGPVATRFLSAHGADVMRIDPPGFDEVDLLLRETTVGKRRAFVDLRSEDGRARFEQLVRGADLLVHGYRPFALARLGYDEAALRALQPQLVIGQLSAYGDSGPWGGRRGFDSLVQMSCGIAARGQARAGADRPVPLPAQALDHGTGFLLAAACMRALTARHRTGEVATVRLSLARTAAHLMDLGEAGDPHAQALGQDRIEAYLLDVASDFGRLRQVPSPGHILGLDTRHTRPAGRLGAHAPAW